MSSRGKKRVPQAYGSGRGDRGGLNGGRPMNSKGLPHFEGAYKNKRLVHAIISLTGCMVEIRKQDGEIYQGVLRTMSPQVDLVLEAACRCSDGDKIQIQPLNKSSIIHTLVVPWSEIVTVSSLSNNNRKEIFKTDSEISYTSNGVNTSRELQPFEFDGSVDETGELVDEVNSSGWAPQEMFDTNKSKFKVTSSFNPEMPEYTTSLELQDSEEDQRRVVEAERKAREIENEGMIRRGGIDDVGTEEEKYSAVLIPNQEKQDVTNDPWNGTEPVVDKNGNESADVKNGNEPVAKNENETTEALPPEAVKEVKSEEPQSQTLDTEGDEVIIKSETGSETQETQPQTVLDEEPKKPSFKLNPDALEFKPTMSSSVTPAVANTSPPTSHVSTYSNSRGPRQKGPRAPRPPHFTDQQQGAYGYHLSLQAGGIRQMIHPQAAAQLPAHLTSPTNLVVRQQLTSPVLAQHGGQAMYTLPPSIAQSPISQQLFIPVSQPAAMFGHAHHSLGHTLPQSPVVYLQSPLHPHSFGQPGGFIPPPQLGGSATGLMGFPQQQMGKQ